MKITLRQLAVLALALAVTGFGLSRGSADSDPGQTFPDVKHKLWEHECSSCHMLYSPGMLPARSWSRMMKELKDHFGENATLAPEDAALIEKHLVNNAADGMGANVRMRRIASSIAAADAPQRFSETAHFRYIHDDIPKGVWKREKIGSPANCIACHPKADQGRYPEREIRIPK